MTPYNLKRRAVAAFKTYEVPKHVRRAYQRQWLTQVQQLGDKWLGFPHRGSHQQAIGGAAGSA